ncbi:hypothetical protein EDB83DRAFT_2313285 [Lactarius deliciosus]|nr:hypothetical protein EDB83DRAFT_2313285 [Lactarius deliciosus]
MPGSCGGHIRTPIPKAPGSGSRVGMGSGCSPRVVNAHTLSAVPQLHLLSHHLLAMPLAASPTKGIFTVSEWLQGKSCAGSGETMTDTMDVTILDGTVFCLLAATTTSLRMDILRFNPMTQSSASSKSSSLVVSHFSMYFSTLSSLPTQPQAQPRPQWDTITGIIETTSLIVSHFSMYFSTSSSLPTRPQAQPHPQWGNPHTANIQAYELLHMWSSHGLDTIDDETILDNIVFCLSAATTTSSRTDILRFNPTYDMIINIIKMTSLVMSHFSNLELPSPGLKLGPVLDGWYCLKRS